jgi:hypothetical protein
VMNNCRQSTVTGKLQTVSSVLTTQDSSNPGKFFESFPSYGSKVDYTIVSSGTASNGVDYVVEYDCGSILNIFDNYCVHILAKEPSIPQEDVDKILAYVETLNVNTQNIKYKQTIQDGCTYTSETE